MGKKETLCLQVIGVISTGLEILMHIVATCPLRTIIAFLQSLPPWWWMKAMRFKFTRNIVERKLLVSTSRLVRSYVLRSSVLAIWRHMSKVDLKRRHYGVNARQYSLGYIAFPLVFWFVLHVTDHHPSIAHFHPFICMWWPKSMKIDLVGVRPVSMCV
jgi:hypothetical protein